MILRVDDQEVSTYEQRGKLKIPITYASKSVLAPDVIRGSFSANIKIPADHNNRRIFGNPLSYSNEDDRRIRKVTLSEGASVFEGIAVLRERSDEEYTLHLIGDNADWFTPLRDVELSKLELGFVEIDKTLQRDTHGDPDNLLYFGVVDYGSFIGRAEGYDIEVDKIYPSIRLKKLIELGFNEAGKSIKWKGSLSKLNWMIPWTGGKPYVIEDQRDEDFAAAFLDTDEDIDWDGNRHIVPVDTEITDDGDNLDVSGIGMLYTTPDYMERMTLKCPMRIDFPSHAGEGDEFRFFIVEDPSGDNVILEETVLVVDKPGTSFPETRLIEYVAADFAVKPNTEYGLYYNSARVGGPNSGTSDITFTTSIPNWIVESLIYGDGFKWDIARNLPNITLIDLVKSLNNMYNIVWEDDGDSVIATPYEEWRSYDTDDWTQKVDLNRPQRWQRFRQDKEVHFLYEKDDKDYYMEIYRDRFQHDPSFGDVEFISDDENLKNVKEIQNKFAATDVQSRLGGFMVPVMYRDADRASDTDPHYQVDSYTFDLRILLEDYQDGVWTHDGDDMTGTPFPTFRFWDPTLRPEDDNLSFAEYEGNGAVGLVQKYWRSHIELWKTGRRMIGYFQINPQDLRMMDFSRPKEVGTTHGSRVVYVEEISQYKHGDIRPTKLICYEF